MRTAISESSDGQGSAASTLGADPSPLLPDSPDGGQKTSPLLAAGEALSAGSVTEVAAAAAAATAAEAAAAMTLALLLLVLNGTLGSPGGFTEGDNCGEARTPTGATVLEGPTDGITRRRLPTAAGLRGNVPKGCGATDIFAAGDIRTGIVIPRTYLGDEQLAVNMEGAGVHSCDVSLPMVEQPSS